MQRHKQKQASTPALATTTIRIRPSVADDCLNTEDPGNPPYERVAYGKVNHYPVPYNVAWWIGYAGEYPLTQPICYNAGVFVSQYLSTAEGQALTHVYNVAGAIKPSPSTSMDYRNGSTGEFPTDASENCMQQEDPGSPFDSARSAYHRFYPSASYTTRWVAYAAQGACEDYGLFTQSGTSQCSEVPDLSDDELEVGPAHCEVTPGINQGNPIQVGSGNKYQVESDYQGTGPMPLAFTRYYNSVHGTWRHSYERELEIKSTYWVVAHRHDGTKLSYWRNDTQDPWSTYAHNPLELTYDGTSQEYELVTRNGDTETYDSAGKLIELADQAGLVQQLTYNGSGQLTQVLHYTGRTLAFTYDTNDRLSTVTDPASQSIQYNYDTSDRLTSVDYPDAAGTVTRTYHYENSSYPNALTGITDENGDRYATWSYDSSGRATNSQHAGSVNSTTLSYDAGGDVTVTNSLSKDAIFSFTDINGVQQITQVAGQATTLCGASTSSLTYDPNGFVDVRTDENGNETDYDYNSRGLLTTLTEAVGETEQRITTTTWHADFRVPTQIVKPGQTIDMTYDTAGRLLTRTIKDTQTQSVPYTTTNNTRTWTYTYNAAGLVATINGPRTDVTDTTTFTYDANDELWKVTNALSQVETEIVSRNSLGLPTAVKDINGVTTELAYDVRGRLTSRTVKSSQGDAVTEFTYDDAGQLIEIELPDSSTLAYEYDDAHRLTAVENNLGERIEYTLDAAGNRTTEVIKNASSTIVKTQSRVFDELSRLREDLGANSQSFEYDYDLGGNLTDLEDTLTRQTDQSFDALDRLIEVIDPDLNDADYAYDDRDNLTSVTDPKGITTTYIYDGMDNLIQESSPDAGTIEYVYDAAGNLTQRTDARGVVTNYTYDAQNRVLTESFPG